VPITLDDRDQLIPLSEVPRLRIIPRRRGGKRLNYSTLWRWCMRGMHGVKLEIVRVGATPCTTKQALLDFFRALRPANDTNEIQAPRTARQQRRAAERAKKQLEEFGI
jgi:hypothetical protein